MQAASYLRLSIVIGHVIGLGDGSVRLIPVCYSACDVVAWDENYLGPAALNRAWTLVNDAKHSARNETLNSALDTGGCGSCHSMGNCTRHCPVGLSPSAGIAGLKKAALRGIPVADKS